VAAEEVEREEREEKEEDEEESSGQEREVVSNSRKRSGAGGVGGTSLKYKRLISVDLIYMCIYSNPPKL